MALTNLSSGGSTTYTAPVTVTGAYTISNTDSLVRVNNTSGAFSVTMPSPALNIGRTITIANIGTGTNLVTVNPNGTETFGSAAYTAIHLSTAGESWSLVSDGTNWQVNGHYCRTAPASFTMVLTLANAGTAPGKGTVNIDQAYWWRDGNRMYVTYSYAQTAAGTTGGGGSAVLYGGWPSAFLIDTSQLPVSSSAFRHVPGSSIAYFPSWTTLVSAPLAYDTSHIAISAGGVTGMTTGAINYAATGTSLVTLDVNFPIANWEP